MSNEKPTIEYDPPSFLCGELNVAKDVMPALAHSNQSLFLLLHRHGRGDWGEVDDATRQANIRGLKYGFRLKSKYPLADGTFVVIRTNAACTETTVDIEDE